MLEPLSEPEYRRKLLVLRNGGMKDCIKTKMQAACQLPRPFFHLEFWDLDRGLTNKLLTRRINDLHDLVTVPTRVIGGGKGREKIEALLASYGLRLGMHDDDIRDWIRSRLGGLEP